MKLDCLLTIPLSIRRVLMLLLLMHASIWAASANAACSVYAGDAAFNEYYFGTDTNFLEVFIKNTNVISQADWQDWTVRVYTSPASFTDYAINDSTSSYCTFGSKAYITHEIPGGLPDPDVSVVLLDASGNEIDYLDTCGPPDSCSLPGFYTPEPAVCSSIDHEHKIGSLGNKDLSRFPDGEGEWDISGGTGSGTSFTSCAPNNAGIIKLSDVAAVELGSNFTFTLNLLNNTNKDETFTVEDTMPTGFTYVSSVPSQGSVDVSALPLLTWNAGSVAKKVGAASLDIVVTGSVLGLHENTATLVAPCDDPADCSQDFASVEVVPVTPSTDHFDINHDTTAINCEAEPITIEAHNADHTISDGYSGTLNLSTSTARGDWSVITGLGSLVNGVTNDGIATYNMVAGDNGVVVLGLKNTAVETLNINVTDGVISESSGTALLTEDQDLAFAQSGFRFIDVANVATIGNQIAGKDSDLAPNAQSLYLQAIRSSDDGASCSGVFADGSIVNIDLGSTCSNPASCLPGQRVSVSNNAITTAIANPQNQDTGQNYSTLPLRFTTNSRAPMVLNYVDAGEVQLHARYDIPLDGGGASGTLMSGSSNAFVVRPFGFDLDFSGDRATNGMTGVSYAADENGSAFHVAGVVFPLSLTTVGWQSADDTNNDGVPDACADLTDNTPTLNFGNEATAVVPANVVLNQTLVAPAAGNAGTLTTTVHGASFVSGIGNKSIHWDEVGIINLDANAANYLGAGEDVDGNVCNVGRFYPDHFKMQNPVLTNRSDIAICADTFTYMEENFSLDFDVEAYSKSPPASITQNYVGAFAMLQTNVIAEMDFVATHASTNLSARLNVASAGGFTAGVAPVQATVSFDRNTLPDGSFEGMLLGVLPVDSDAVSLLSADLDLSLDGGPVTHQLLSQTNVRYGRLNSKNNFGSELLPLSMPLSTEYYLDSTAQFVMNTDDSCTSISTADILLFNDQAPKAGRVLGNPVIAVSGALTTTLTGVSAFIAGMSTMSFSSPGVPGYVDVEVRTPAYLLSNLDGIDHGVQGPGLHCNPALAGSGDPADINPCVADLNFIDDIPLSRGSFGLFKGSDNVIYTREVY